LVYENAVEFGFSRIFILALSFSLGGLEGGGLMLGSAFGLEFKAAGTDNPGAEEWGTDIFAAVLGPRTLASEVALRDTVPALFDGGGIDGWGSLLRFGEAGAAIVACTDDVGPVSEGVG
jgi:hypothetical protein